MSKQVKDLVQQEFAKRLEGIDSALLVNVIGLTANKTYVLRKRLRGQNINLMVIRNGLARRATEGTPLAAAFDGAEGSLAFVWGAEDFVALTKEITKLDQTDDFKEFKTRGGVMDGERLSPERVKEISKWPSRGEQLSILSGQILSPGANLLAAINGPGANLASQIKQKSESADTVAPEEIE